MPVNTAFNWYFRLPASQKRTINKAIRLLCRTGFKTPEDALEFLYTQHTDRYGV